MTKIKEREARTRENQSNHGKKEEEELNANRLVSLWIDYMNLSQFPKCVCDLAREILLTGEDMQPSELSTPIITII